MDPRKQQGLVLPNYPYKNAFTAEQVRDALDRKDKLVELLMDPVGPDGTIINIPVDMLHVLAFHLAYAGTDTHTDYRQLIVSRVARYDDSLFEVTEWFPKGSQPEQEKPAAADAAERVKQQLTPEVRAALTEILIAEYQAATEVQTNREKAENVLIEQRLKGN